MALILTALSCDNFMDVHKEYIEGGEIIYAPKVDSVSFVAGKGRLLCNFWLYNSPNVKSVDVYWNSYQDSLIIPVTPSAGLDSLSVILPNMEEKSYTFDVRTTDNYGHKSLWVTEFGNSYGTTYEATLIQRRVREVTLSDKGGEITWFAGGAGLTRTEVRYPTISGETETVYTSADESVTFCPNAQAGATFDFRSLYIPEDQSIDTFALEWTEAGTPFPSIFEYDRSDWKVIAVSDETASDGGGMNTLLDGDLGTFWHSQWDGGNAPLPHWAIIDMGSAKNIVRIDIYRRQGNTDSKTVRFFVGNNPDPDAGAWIQIGEGEFASGDKLTVEISPSMDTRQGRYLKILLPDSNRDPFTSIAEIYLYGN